MLHDYYVFDLYSLVHLWWGTLYGWILSPLVIPFVSWTAGFLIALSLALVWEWVENHLEVLKTCWRPCGFKYSQDSWANMVGDVISSSVGYLLIFFFQDHYQEIFILTTSVCVVCIVYCHWIHPQQRDLQYQLQDHFNRNGRCDCVNFQKYFSQDVELIDEVELMDEEIQKKRYKDWTLQPMTNG